MSNARVPGPLNGADSLDQGTLALTPSATPESIGCAGGTLLEETDHRADLGDLPFDWQRLGFKSPPRVVVSDGRPLFRVWGGTSLERGDPRSRGVFYSFQRPASRLEAERLFAIAEFGNACTVVSRFDVPAGTPMLVGDVDPGSFVHPTLEGAGEQVFIKNPWAQRLIRVGPASRLADDMGGARVYSGPKTREPEKGAKGGWN